MKYTIFTGIESCWAVVDVATVFFLCYDKG